MGLGDRASTPPKVNQVDLSVCVFTLHIRRFRETRSRGLPSPMFYTITLSNHALDCQIEQEMLLVG